MLMIVFLMVVYVLFLALLKMIHVVSWKIWILCIEFGLVFDVARACFSQLNFVQYMRFTTFGMSIAGFWHVDSWGVSELWATGGAYVKAICDIAGSRIGADLIDWEAIVIVFNSKNFEILCVKRSENKATICLVRFLFHNQVAVDSSGICPGWVQLF